MAYIKCIEPNMNDTQHSVVTAGEDDTLELPAVDSCMAVVFIMNDWSMVGGHIGMFGFGPTENQMGDECTRTIVNNMIEQVGNIDNLGRILVVTDIARGDVGLGWPRDPNYFNTSIPSRLVLAKRTRPFLVTKIAKGGVIVDVVVVGKARQLNIYKTAGKKLLYSKPINQLPTKGVTRYS
jgi:hypothetical protein